MSRSQRDRQRLSCILSESGYSGLKDSQDRLSIILMVIDVINPYSDAHLSNSKLSSNLFRI